MFLRIFRSPMLASILLVVGAQLFVSELHAKTTYQASGASRVGLTKVAYKPIAGRNRRVANMNSYRGHYPRAVGDQITVSTKAHKLRINVLSNDFGNSLKIKEVNNQSARGGRIYRQGRHVVYSPRANFRGWDSFWYAVVDVNGHRHSAKVNVCVCHI